MGRLVFTSIFFFNELNILFSLGWFSHIHDVRFVTCCRHPREEMFLTCAGVSYLVFLGGSHAVYTSTHSTRPFLGTRGMLVPSSVDG